MWPFQSDSEVSHLVSADGIQFFVTTESILGACFQGGVFDYETSDLSMLHSKFQDLLGSLSERQLLRIQQSVEGPVGSRVASLKLTIEERIPGIASMNGAKLRKRIEKWLATAPMSKVRDLGFASISLDGLRAQIATETVPLIRKGHSLVSGKNWQGCIRLNRQTALEVDWETLFSATRTIPTPFRVVATISTLDRLQTQRELRLIESKRRNSSDPTEMLEVGAAQSALISTFANDEALCKVEWLLLLERASESELALDLTRAASSLGTLGETYVETVGLRPSIRASRLGSPQHYTFKEVSSVAPLFLPVIGCSEASIARSPSAMRLERTDGTAFYFDPFDPQWGGCNIVINGKRGGGKSVTANILSKALLSEPTCQMIKFDVGGSYRKECALANGSIFDFRMDEPSGINPFESIRPGFGSSDEIRSLAGFVGALIQESGEHQLPDALAAQIEVQLAKYLSNSHEDKSLAAFVESSKDLPRRELLLRWASGVYRNVFKATPDTRERLKNRYVYFNLEHLHSAADTTYIRGVFAALIAYANIAMLEAGDARTQNRKRLVLFGDEVPFVSRVYADYLKFTTANFRKFGHGTVLIAQSFDSLRIEKPGHDPDFGILKNSPIRFIFDAEVPEERFARDFQVDQSELRKIKSLYRGADYRECLLQTPDQKRGVSSRTLRIRLTPEQYWEFTSSEQDNRKIYDLVRAVPGLTLKEAIKCLSSVS